MEQNNADTDELPDGKNVCPGCGGYVDHDEYKCDRCSDDSLWGEQ